MKSTGHCNHPPVSQPLGRSEQILNRQQQSSRPTCIPFESDHPHDTHHITTIHHIKPLQPKPDTQSTSYPITYLTTNGPPKPQPKAPTLTHTHHHPHAMPTPISHPPNPLSTSTSFLTTSFMYHDLGIPSYRRSTDPSILQLAKKEKESGRLRFLFAY